MFIVITFSVVKGKWHFVTDVMCYVTSAKGFILVVSM